MKRILARHNDSFSCKCSGALLTYYILTLLALIAVSLVLGTSYFRAQYLQLRDQSQDNLNAIANLKKSQIERWYSGHVLDSHRISKSAQTKSSLTELLKGTASKDAGEGIAEWMDAIRQLGYNRITIYDKNGQPIFCSPSSDLDALARRGELHKQKIKETLSKSDVWVSDLHVCDATPSKEICMEFWIPLKLQPNSNAVQGAICLSVHAKDFLFPFIQEWPIPSKTSETLLSRLDGDKIVFLNDIRHRKETSLKLSIPLADAKNLPAGKVMQMDGFSEGVDYRGVSVMASYRKIQGTPWFLVAKTDLSEIYEPVRERAWTTGAITFFCILFFSFIIRNRYLQRSREIKNAIFESAEKLQIVFEESGHAIFWADPKTGILIKANREACRLLGKPESEIVGQHMQTLHPPDAVERTKSAFDEFARGSDIKLYETEVLTASGDRRNILIKPSVINLPSGRILQGVFLDITEIKNKEAQIRDIGMRLQLILNSAGQGILGLDQEGRHTFINPVAADMLGWTANEMMGQKSHSMWHHTHADASPYCAEECKIYETLRSQKKVLVNNEVFWRKDGTSIPVEYIAAPIVENERTLGAVVIFSDITSRIKAEQKLHQALIAAESANRAKSEFLAMMSHELRTPLNGVLGFAEILSLSEGMNDEQNSFVLTIKECGNNLLLLINDILDLARIEADKLDFEDHSFSLSNVIASAIRPMELKMKDKGLSCSVECDPNTKVTADSKRIRQVLFNLLSNAVKFTSHGGIEIVAETHRDATNKIFVTIVVNDSGIGIESDELTKLFQPFSQANSSATRSHDGTGLGLVISRKIARKMGGDVFLESTPKKGTRAVFTFRATSTNDKIDAPKKITDEKSLNKIIRILAVDDNTVNLKLLEKALCTITTDIDLVSDPNEAVRMSAQKKYTHFLIDIRMPQMNGVQCMNQIKSVHTSPAIYAALTAFAMDGDEKKYLDAGFDIYFSKPLNLAALRKHLSSLHPAQ